MTKAFDEILKKYKNYDVENFASDIDNHNEKEDHWSFFDFVHETIKAGGLSYEDGFNMTCCYIGQKQQEGN